MRFYKGASKKPMMMIINLFTQESYNNPQRLSFQIHGQDGPHSYRWLWFYLALVHFTMITMISISTLTVVWKWNVALILSSSCIFYDDYYDGGNFNFDNFRYGYDTGVGYNRQFKYEERDNYGVLHGRWVWLFSSSYLKMLWRTSIGGGVDISSFYLIILRSPSRWCWWWCYGFGFGLVEKIVSKRFSERTSNISSVRRILLLLKNSQLMIYTWRRGTQALSRLSIWFNWKIDYPKPKWKFIGHLWRACNKSTSFARLNWWLRPVTNCDWEQLTNANS